MLDGHYEKIAVWLTIFVAVTTTSITATLTTIFFFFVLWLIYKL